jgi:phage virion morphogenesis protein
MTQVSIKINDAAVQTVFARAIAKLSDLTPVMTDVGEYLQRRVDDGFRTETDPYGKPWAKLASSTLRQKVRQKRILKILQSRGTMRGTLTYRASRDRVLIGFNVFYADFHQRGTVRVVKRQLLPDAARGLPAQDVAAIVSIAEDYLKP